VARSDLTRVLNWDVRLVQYAGRLQGEAFEWGVTDCGTLVRGALTVLYDHDVLEAALGAPWTSLRGAAGAWRAVGSVQSVLGALKAVEVPGAFVQAGDVGVFPGEDVDGLPRLVVCIGARILTVHRERGVEVVWSSVLPGGTRFWRLP